MPARVGRYELLFDIGAGGMATVYLARQLGDSGFERLVAVKRVHRHLVRDEETYAMVSDEARIAALLRHPNVVPVIDVVDQGGELLLVLDYVEGFSLSALLRAHQKSRGADTGLSPALASRIAVDALRGLHAAHEASDLLGASLDLVHRDVSPENLLVGADGTTRVIDFGIARAVGNLQMTSAGVLKGKVAYMAPERVGQGDVDRRTDIYSVGAVLLEMLSGAAPHANGDEAVALARAMLGDLDLAPARAASARAGDVVERAVARLPSERYATAEEMARALAAAEPPAPPEEVAKWVLRHKSTEITARRDRIREAIAVVAEVEEGSPSGERTRIEGGVDARSLVAARPPARRGLLVAFLLFAANVAAWALFIRFREDTPRGRTPTLSADTATTHTESAAPSPSASAPREMVTERPIASPATTASATASATASSHGPAQTPTVILHTNPYPRGGTQ